MPPSKLGSVHIASRFCRNYTKERLATTTRSAYDARKRMFKPEIVTHDRSHNPSHFINTRKEGTCRSSAFSCRSLLQSVKIAVEVDSRPGRDVGADNLIRVLYTRNPFLGDKLPRGPDYCFTGEHQVRHLDTGSGDKPV